ncbi:MAG: hypothetical protein Q8S13_13695, partial [Dehalococcoidia bacterium]|nr:hypothetical protein [Dehalococcoidia bacterium]
MRRLLFVLAIAAVATAALVAGAIKRWDSESAGAAGTGGTISTIEPSGGFSQWTALALDANGLPVVIYHEAYDELGTGETEGLYLARCGDASCTSGTVKTLLEPDAQQGALAVDAADNPVVAYEGQAGYLHVLRCGNPTCTAGNTIATPDLAALNVAEMSIAIDADDRPVVSYYASDAADLKLLRCGNAACTAGNSVTSPDTEGEVGFFTSLRLDSTGIPVVAYSGPNLKILRCGNFACTVGNSIVTPDAGIGAALYPSLELDGSDRPAVSYQKVKHLRVLRCGSTTCAPGSGTNTINEPDTAGDVGDYSSIELDASGNPVVSYHFDVGATGVRLLHCGDAACSAGNTIAPIDDLGGTFTSLELDASGNPVISYKAVAPVKGIGDVFSTLVAHCGNPSCSGAKPTPTPTPTATSTATPTPCPTEGCPTATPT